MSKMSISTDQMNEPSTSAYDSDGNETIKVPEERKVNQPNNRKKDKNDERFRVKISPFVSNTNMDKNSYRFKVFRAMFREFLKNSSICGLSYFSERRRHWTER